MALQLISDHVVPTWTVGRLPTDAEIHRTMVLAVPMVEMSAKVRSGDPVDEPEDLPGPFWGGHVPIQSTWMEPVPSTDLIESARPVPSAVARLAGRSTH
jgi:hypothetical protein